MLEISAQIFEFGFNPYALLSLLGIVVTLTLIYLIQSRGIQNSANKWFTGFLILLVWWGIGEFFGRISANPVAAEFWGNISPPGWVFVGLFFFMFTLAYTDRESLFDSVNRKVLLFGSGAFWLFLVWNTPYISSHGELHEVAWGWETTPQTGPYFTFFLLWLESFFIASLVLLIRYYFKNTEALKRKQTLFLIVGLLIPLIGGTITDAVLPTLGYSVPGTAILLTAALGALATFAILRYKLFTINPATHFANIVKTMNEALIVLNLGQGIEFTNDAVSRLFSFTAGELKGAKIQTLIKNESDLAMFEEKYVGRMKKGEVIASLEINLSSKNGEEIPVNLSGAPLIDGGQTPVGFVMIASDMREMKKLVYNLVAERNKLSVTLSGITEGVFVVDKDGIISFFNEAAENIFGIKAAMIIGKKADQVLKIFDQDGQVLVEYFFPKEKLSKDMVTFSRNGVRIELPDGKSKFANLIAANIVEGEGINLGAIVTIHDVSKEKDLEEMKLDFVSMAAHELRTPLTSIRGYLSVLQEELKAKLNSDQSSFLEKAFISSTQLAALVENLLSVSRIERGSLQIQTQVSDWDTILSESYENFEPQAHERQVKFTYIKPTKKLPYVLVDKFRISEVVSNLIGNALNYTPSGGTVEVSAEVVEDSVVTHVKDTGPGIPEQAIPKLFTKFFRVSGVLEQGSKGTGLGLYISKSIVDMHKGRIWVDSEIGKGSVFSFSVPVSKDQTLQQTVLQQKGKRMFLRKPEKV